MRRPRVLVAVLALAAALPLAPRDAAACGCVTPAATSVSVNQQAEQIIFEIDPGFITAHVLIQYAGDPSQFAWLVPVPSVPELGLSPPEVFALLDAVTSPQISVYDEDLCPRSEYVCAYHPLPECLDPWDDHGRPDGRRVDGIALSDGAASGGGTPVEIHTRTTVGDYEVIVFGTGSGDAREAVAWLQGEGFVVNDTMAEYMTPYVVEGDLFLAARLVPGAGVGAIKPLRMKFADDEPMIPLRLTAVAADPHMTVTSYVYADGPVAAHGKATVAIQAYDIGRDRSGRTNYPMALAATIDRAGGDGYVTEFAGPPPAALDLDGRGCCALGGAFDPCGIQYDGVCSCPANPLDATDCAAETGLVEGATLMADLASRHTYVTRLTTRLSPEEMTTDPMFRRVERSAFEGRLALTGVRESLDACGSDVMDQGAFQTLRATEDCATVYCGKGGTCAAGVRGVGCACDPGTVARQFVDLDARPSVTCVPERPPVDFEAGGLDRPDACVGITCGGGGTCADLNGVAHCKCAAGEVAVVRESATTPSCEPIGARAADAGGHNVSHDLQDLPVCAPPPPACGEGGWLYRTTTGSPGIDCGDATPPASALVEPPRPTCPDQGFVASTLGGCGCRVGGARGGVGLGGLVLAALAAMAYVTRGRRR